MLSPMLVVYENIHESSSLWLGCDKSSTQRNGLIQNHQLQKWFLSKTWVDSVKPRDIRQIDCLSSLSNESLSGRHAMEWKGRSPLTQDLDNSPENGVKIFENFFWGENESSKAGERSSHQPSFSQLQIISDSIDINLTAWMLFRSFARLVCDQCRRVQEDRTILLAIEHLQIFWCVLHCLCVSCTPSQNAIRRKEQIIIVKKVTC
jgi:hypothetical protein